MPRTALIIDDDPDVREAIAGVFAARAWHTVQGEDGSMALDLALGCTPDLIVLDVMMPVQDGWATLRELRGDERVGHVPVFMLSSVNDYELGMNYDAELAGKKANVRPPEAFLDKPLDTGAFWEAVVGITGG